MNEFIDGYIACCLWLATDENGDHFEGDIDDVAEGSLARMKADAESFFKANEALIDKAAEADCYGYSTAGHDFFLTRNRHGAGYWDRDLGNVGNDLTTLAEIEGEAYAYLGDDGMIHYHS